jgi:2-beta-glucuronyltransferase
MKRVVLVSWHYFESKRQAGFHWLADAWWRAGWEVVFFTAALSRLSRLRRDPRLAYLPGDPPNRLRWVRPRLASFVWFTAWHPANLRLGLLNRLSRPLFRRYGSLDLGEVEPLVASADLVVLESSPGLLLFERFRRLAPKARFVYRVSDDLRLLKNHPVVIEAEDRLAGEFDLVSVPSGRLFERFRHLPAAGLHHHGLRKEAFDQPRDAPYEEGWDAHAVFTGNAHFDHEFLGIASAAFPRWGFHVIGPIDDLPARPNVFAYGELPFAATVPFLQHADVGLHTLAYAPGAESFTDSLKVIQYTYCRLPVVAPEFLRCDRPNLCYYQPGDAESIRRALAAARAFDRSSIRTDGVRTWDELAGVLAGEAPVAH